MAAVRVAAVRVAVGKVQANGGGSKGDRSESGGMKGGWRR